MSLAEPSISANVGESQRITELSEAADVNNHVENTSEINQSINKTNGHVVHAVNGYIKDYPNLHKLSTKHGMCFYCFVFYLADLKANILIIKKSSLSVD